MDKTNSKNRLNKEPSKMTGPARKVYSAPQILGKEILEAAAVACGVTGPTLGKTFPAPPCSVLGS